MALLLPLLVVLFGSCEGLKPLGLLFKRRDPNSTVGKEVHMHSARQSALTKLQNSVLMKNLSTLVEVEKNFTNDTSLLDQVAEVFDDFVNKTQVNQELTPEEHDTFKARFQENVDINLKRLGVENGGSLLEDQKLKKKVIELLPKVFENQKPVGTKFTVAHVNKADLGWIAEGQDDHVNISLEDLATLCGTRPGDEEIENEQKLCEDLGGCVSQDVDKVDAAVGFTQTTQDEEIFDAREEWPDCADVIGQVRDQGHCGSCWAVSTAAMMENRLCISSKGAFTGPSAFISGGFITSCAYQGKRDGCSGGHPLQALRLAATKGVPTGGSGDNSKTCVPYFGNGDALKHFAVKGGAPACPSRCTSEKYTRSLNADLFIPEGFKDSFITFDYEKAKENIKTSGSIVLMFAVYSDFMSYKRGIYRPAATQKMGYHAVLAIGYGPDYLYCVNSWGTKWGDKGHFKIHKDAVQSYTIPGDIKGLGGGYPYPINEGGAPPLTQMKPFKVVHGECTVDDNGCVMSPNYPDTYTPQMCRISVDEQWKDRFAGEGIAVHAFNTEDKFDYLEVNGQKFSNNKGPQGIVPEGDILWKPDDNYAGTGWKICTPGQAQLMMHEEKVSPKGDVITVNTLKHSGKVAIIVLAVTSGLGVLFLINGIIQRLFGTVPAA